MGSKHWVRVKSEMLERIIAKQLHDNILMKPHTTIALKRAQQFFFEKMGKIERQSK
jgi:hypothetical protein